MTSADLREYIAFNREFVSDVQAGMKAGKSIDDVANNWKIPASCQRLRADHHAGRQGPRQEQRHPRAQRAREQRHEVAPRLNEDGVTAMIPVPRFLAPAFAPPTVRFRATPHK